MTEGISREDREILRQYAREQMEIANSQEMETRNREWKALNGYRMIRPMILLEMGTFEAELLPDRMRCQGKAAREIEKQFLRQMLPYTLYGDDTVVTPYFPVRYRTWFKLFGHTIERTSATDTQDRAIGHHFNEIITDLEDDWDQLGPSQWGADVQGTMAWKALLEETFGDILPVQLHMGCLYAVPTQEVVHRMSMETMLFSMMDYPELFLKMMGRIADDTIAYFKWQEQEGLLLPTNGADWLGQGTYCFTEELPRNEGTKPDHPITTKEVWGFLDSQETVGISPEMFEELVFPCYERIAAEYGLLSYGCCEPVDKVWDSCLSKLENLRKVSISPWCDQTFMGEQLRGKNVVYQRKPSPNYLGVDKTLDEDALRAHIMETVRAAQGCTYEITQRDVYTIHGNPDKARRYVEILRECTQG